MNITQDQLINQKKRYDFSIYFWSSMCFLTTGQQALEWADMVALAAGSCGGWGRQTVCLFYFLFFIFITTLKSYDSQR
jgi:hypothetical protein